MKTLGRLEGEMLGNTKKKGISEKRRSGKGAGNPRDTSNDHTEDTDGREE